MQVIDADSWWCWPVYRCNGYGVNIVFAHHLTYTEINTQSVFKQSRSGIDSSNRFNNVEHIKLTGSLTTQAPDISGAIPVNAGQPFAHSFHWESNGFEYYGGIVSMLLEPAPSEYISDRMALGTWTSSRPLDSFGSWNNIMLQISAYDYNLDQSDRIKFGFNPTFRHYTGVRESLSGWSLIYPFYTEEASTFSSEPWTSEQALLVLTHSISVEKARRPVGYYQYGYGRGIDFPDEWGRPSSSAGQFGSMGKTQLIPSENFVLDAYRRHLEPILSRRNTYCDVWPQLAARAYGSNEFWDGNGIALLKDISEIGRAARSSAQVIKAIPASKGKVIAKTASALYLSVHYGWKLLVSDCYELSSAFMQLAAKTSRCQAHVTEEHEGGIQVTYRYQVYYRMFEQLANELTIMAELMDANLDLSNAWDFVPWSFVLDWFTNIGDTAASIDAYVDLIQRHRIVAVGKSVKASCPIGSDAVLEYYSREYSLKPVFPDPTLHVTIDPNVTQFVDGGALVIQRIC